jgi:hypothetical protein
MAPTIQPPSQDTINALQNVLKRRIDTNRILKDREKKMLSGEDYWLMEVNLNQKQFLQPLILDRNLSGTLGQVSEDETLCTHTAKASSQRNCRYSLKFEQL